MARCACCRCQWPAAVNNPGRRSKGWFLADGMDNEQRAAAESLRSCDTMCAAVRLGGRASLSLSSSG